MSTAFAEAPVTTSVGILSRSIEYSSTAGVTGVEGAGQSETLAKPTICERVSTPSALGFEIGAGGCLQTGGEYTFGYTISTHMLLLYYPLASRSNFDDDVALRSKQGSFSNLYIVLLGGFSKITHQQVAETNATISSDVLDFGGGLGYSYRLFDYAALGAEGYYLSGSIMSKAVSGATSAFFAGGTVTFFF
jgi:hypothetical protein